MSLIDDSKNKSTGKGGMIELPLETLIAIFDVAEKYQMAMAEHIKDHRDRLQKQYPVDPSSVPSEEFTAYTSEAARLADLTYYTGQVRKLLEERALHEARHLFGVPGEAASGGPASANRPPRKTEDAGKWGKLLGGQAQGLSQDNPPEKSIELQGDMTKQNEPDDWIEPFKSAYN